MLEIANVKALNEIVLLSAFFDSLCREGKIEGSLLKIIAVPLDLYGWTQKGHSFARKS